MPTFPMLSQVERPPYHPMLFQNVDKAAAPFEGNGNYVLQFLLPGKSSKRISRRSFGMGLVPFVRPMPKNQVLAILLPMSGQS
jgi:hypothetical protein